MADVFIVFLDGSPFAAKAFNNAMRNLDLANDKIYLVAIAEIASAPISAYPLDTAGYARAFDFSDSNRQIEEVATGVLEEYKKKALEAGAKKLHPTLISSVSAPDSAVQFANDKKARCVFVGSRGANGFQRFLLGSFSNHLVNNCKCNVLVVKDTAKHIEASNVAKQEKGAAGTKA